MNYIDGIPELTVLEKQNLRGSANYKDRFVLEYIELRERYSKLKKFNTKIEAGEATRGLSGRVIEEPKHDCPTWMLRQQQSTMGEYLHILEIRAEIEGIDLQNIHIPLRKEYIGYVPDFDQANH